MSGGTSWPRIERALVWLVAAHTLIVGALLLFATEWGLGFGGWASVPDRFFPRQGGAFHLVVGVGYVLEYERHRTVTLLLLAKAIATVFLLAVWALGTEPLPWAIPVSGLGDAAMGVLVAWVHRRSARSPSPDVPLESSGRKP